MASYCMKFFAMTAYSRDKFEMKIAKRFQTKTL